MDSFAKIRYELEQSLDRHSRSLITANIELFLEYCVRFYDRQFLTSDHVHPGILERFEALLNAYLHSEAPSSDGLPSVAWCARELHLSANYFGDLIKKQTGRSVQELIQRKLMDVAKEHQYDPQKSISDVAYELGFRYPQHFSRLFKQQVGQTPQQYRSLS